MARTELLLPVVALAEYLEGFDDPRSQQARALVDPLTVLEINENVAILYAEVSKLLRTSGQQIGTNDLWIGCTARASGLPLVTRNAEHFRRIPELDVIEYRSPAG